MTRLPASRSPAFYLRARAAFTIVELLVTIGIIAALMAILVPVISRERIAAQTANTTNQIQRITGGINNYFHDFNGYPGVVSNNLFATGGFTNVVGGMNPYTQAEDMCLALLGGLTMDFNPATTSKLLTYNKDAVGNGPLVFNKLNPSAKQAYVQKIPSELPTDLNATLASQYPDLVDCKDGPAPEFLDLYSEPRPLIYVRATPGALAGDANVVYNSSGIFDATKHYDYKQVAYYLRKITGDVKVDDPMAKGVTDTSVTQLFSISTSGGAKTAKGPGTYIIFSAGPDRLFGTQDDIIYTGGGGQ